MRGRPTLYQAENAELARKFCMLGATNEDLARCFEVSRSTIDHWIDTISEFADSIQEGRDLADAAVIQMLYSRAMGFTIRALKRTPQGFFVHLQPTTGVSATKVFPGGLRPPAIAKSLAEIAGIAEMDVCGAPRG